MDEKDLLIAELEHKLKYTEEIIRTMDVPIIESVLSRTILMPITGHLFPERIEMIDQHLFKYLNEHRLVQIIIIDFTAISQNYIALIDGETLSAALSNLNQTLQVIGIRAIYTGFQPEVAYTFINSGFSQKIETYPAYRNAVMKLVAEGQGIE